MKNKDFAHLHNHTEFSILDGFGTVKGYAERASQLGFKYLACTDHGNIDGLIQFQKACEENNVNPVHGCEAYIVPDMMEKKKKERRGHITLLVKNRQGWKNLCRLVNISNMEGFYNRPRIDYESLLKRCEGLVIMSACVGTFLRLDGAEGFLRRLLNKTEDVYLEAMPHDIDLQRKVNKKIDRYHKKYDLKYVATNDCHYIKNNDDIMQEILLAIQTKAKWNDKKRFRFSFKGLHLKTANQMIRSFDKQGFYSKKKYIGAMENTIEVAEKCKNFKIKKMGVRLPRVADAYYIAGGANLGDDDTALYNYCLKGLARIGKFKSKRYRRRLQEEFKLIKSKDFSRYFSIVFDVVDWAKKKEIIIGPGRGSVGGCLIAYLLGITSVDPIEHDLMFSRFINEDRVDYPDIDVDFEAEKRHMIRSYLGAQYGKNNVAGISTFGRLKGRSAIRDIARVFDISDLFTDQFAKQIERLGDMEENIDSVVEDTDIGRRYASKHPEIIDYAKRIAGQVRSAGQHPSAIIVSCGDMRKRGRCSLVNRKNTLVANWEQNDCEYMGLMKLDILGLKTLSVLGETKSLVEENKKVKIKYEEIPLDDKKVLKDISKGNTVGVFQIGTPATTSLIKEMGVESFQHISDAVALVRPGPHDSGMTKNYIKRKHGARWKRKNEIYEEITKDTYGVIVYQEQVMAVISKVAGLPYSTADKIRKVIGKKRDAKEFEPFKKQFIDGCLEHKTFDKEEAEEFWEGLQDHAHYSFNKSHSVGYAMVAYWMAWCKYYYPEEFICASLTYGQDAKKEDLISEANRLGLNLITPKIGISDTVRWKAKNGNLYIPFAEVKGLAEASLHEISKLRPRKSISSLFENKEISSYNRENIKTNVDRILSRICAYSEDTPDVKTMRELFPNFTFENKSIDIKIKKKTFKIKKKLFKCRECGLRRQARKPVQPSPGRYNIIINGEAPGPEEDKRGYGFVEIHAGKLLWNTLKRHGYRREQFHVTNTCKCYPSRTKTPNQAEIIACGDLWLAKEIEAIGCELILGLGNVSAKYFHNTTGIRKLSGKTMWSDRVESWICYCVHPAAVLRNKEANLDYFRAGINNFVYQLKECGVKKMR